MLPRRGSASRSSAGRRRRHPPRGHAVILPPHPALSKWPPRLPSATGSRPRGCRVPLPPSAGPARPVGAPRALGPAGASGSEGRRPGLPGGHEVPARKKDSCFAETRPPSLGRLLHFLQPADGARAQAPGLRGLPGAGRAEGSRASPVSGEGVGHCAPQAVAESRRQEPVCPRSRVGGQNPSSHYLLGAYCVLHAMLCASSAEVYRKARLASKCIYCYVVSEGVVCDLGSGRRGALPATQVNTQRLHRPAFGLARCQGYRLDSPLLKALRAEQGCRQSAPLPIPRLWPLTLPPARPPARELCPRLVRAREKGAEEPKLLQGSSCKTERRHQVPPGPPRERPGRLEGGSGDTCILHVKEGGRGALCTPLPCPPGKQDRSMVG